MHKFTEEEKELCKLIAKARVLIKHKGIRFNDSHFHRKTEDEEREERWYPHFIGLLGELLYMKQNKIPVCFDIKTTGDMFDFGDVEVKTRMSKDKNPMLIIKESEFLRKCPSSYTLIRLEPDLTNGEIVGSVSREIFQRNAKKMMMRGREVLTMRALEIRELQKLAEPTVSMNKKGSGLFFSYREIR